MSEKEEKIINGVDVSMCDMQCANGDCALYYAEVNTDNPELEYGYMCSDNPDCYYKQLQREKIAKTQQASAVNIIVWLMGLLKFLKK